MDTTKYHLENYRKFLLNRVTSSNHIIEYIENSLANDDEAAQHTFHKLMVHNWTGSETGLFETITEYFSCIFIPVNCTCHGQITTFYTSSLNLVLKITKLEFLFPHQRNMFNIDILFNDKTSADCFENRVTIDNIVTGVVSCRLNDKFELDLSNLCNDPEFIQKNIHFYKLSLLAYFKILMLRMGRDTKILNLSNNNLSQVPVEILNFFIKGDLTSIKLNDNNIPSLSELQRISSKIEKLWVEGNPLCTDIDTLNYVKQIVVKFPRLTELDGIRLSEHGIAMPFFKNYLVTPDKRTQMLVEKFLSLYFAHYDSMPRGSIDQFYDNNAKLTISTDIAGDPALEHYTNHARNILTNPKIKKKPKKRMYASRQTITEVFLLLPESVHDPTTFTVDVLRHDTKSLIIILDGIYKEKSANVTTPERLFQFRRTFVFSVNMKNSPTEYLITNEMFTTSLATQDQMKYSFKIPTRTTNPHALKNPDQDNAGALCNVFSHLTQLKKSEAELRLKLRGWDITKALQEFVEDMKVNKITPDRFIDEDDFSDSSSLIDEID